MPACGVARLRKARTLKMLKKGHEFSQKKKRQKVKRKQRRKESEIDRTAVKQRKGIVRVKKEKAPPKKKKKEPKADARIELTDENLTEVMDRYKNSKE